MESKVKFYYVCGNSIATGHFDMSHLSGLRSVSRMTLPAENECYVVQMFDGPFGQGLFLLRGLNDLVEMMHVRFPYDPQPVLQVMPREAFGNIVWD